MTFPAAFIAGDWGTSNLTLALCDEDGQALETRKGPGAADSRGRFEQVFDGLAADWRRESRKPAGRHVRNGGFGVRLARGALSTVSRRPLRARRRAGGRARRGDDRARHALHESARRARCHEGRGNPVARRAVHRWRDERRQTTRLHARHPHQVGLVERQPGAGIPDRARPASCSRCCASTASWYATGRRPSSITPRDFERGLAESAKHPEASLLHRLFQSRSLRLDKQLSAEGAASWMSGLLIGTDVRGALSLFAEHGAGAPVYVVGAPHLTQSYTQALDAKRPGRHTDRGSQRRARGPRIRVSRARAPENFMNTSTRTRRHPAGADVRPRPETGAALVGSGFRTIEVPLNSPDPFDSIRLLSQAHGASCLIGAGTVLTPAEVDRVHGAGGRLVVAPNCGGACDPPRARSRHARAAWYRYRDRGVHRDCAKAPPSSNCFPPRHTGPRICGRSNPCCPNT